MTLCSSFYLKHIKTYLECFYNLLLLFTTLGHQLPDEIIILMTNAHKI